MSPYPSDAGIHAISATPECWRQGCLVQQEEPKTPAPTEKLFLVLNNMDTPVTAPSIKNCVPRLAAL